MAGKIKQTIKGAKRSKTMWFAYAVIIFGYLDSNVSVLQGALGPYYGYAFIGIGLVNVVLRAVTTKALADKASQ